MCVARWKPISFFESRLLCGQLPSQVIDRLSLCSRSRDGDVTAGWSWHTVCRRRGDFPRNDATPDPEFRAVSTVSDSGSHFDEFRMEVKMHGNMIQTRVFIRGEKVSLKCDSKIRRKLTEWQSLDLDRILSSGVQCICTVRLVSETRLSRDRLCSQLKINGLTVVSTTVPGIRSQGVPCLGWE